MLYENSKLFMRQIRILIFIRLLCSNIPYFLWTVYLQFYAEHFSLFKPVN